MEYRADDDDFEKIPLEYPAPNSLRSGSERAGWEKFASLRIPASTGKSRSSCISTEFRPDEDQYLSPALEERYSKREALGTHLAAVYAGLGDKDQAWQGEREERREPRSERARIEFEQGLRSRSVAKPSPADEANGLGIGTAQ